MLKLIQNTSFSAKQTATSMSQHNINNPNNRMSFCV